MAFTQKTPTKRKQLFNIDYNTHSCWNYPGAFLLATSTYRNGAKFLKKSSWVNMSERLNPRCAARDASIANKSRIDPRKHTVSAAATISSKLDSA